LAEFKGVKDCAFEQPRVDQSVDVRFGKGAITDPDPLRHITVPAPGTNREFWFLFRAFRVHGNNREAVSIENMSLSPTIFWRFFSWEHQIDLVSQRPQKSFLFGRSWNCPDSICRPLRTFYCFRL